MEINIKKQGKMEGIHTDGDMDQKLQNIGEVLKVLSRHAHFLLKVAEITCSLHFMF